MEKYDYIVIGAGLAGGIFARMLAENDKKKILIVERRNHIAGNTFDFEDEHGIKTQKYGPHVLHTNSDEVYKFITKFCTPIKYKTKCEAVIDGVSTPSPFNFKTIDQFYDKEKGEELKTKLLNYYDNRASVTVVEMLKSNDEDIKGFADFLFEKDYKLYTSKQWNLQPNEIDPSVLKRVPIVLSYGDTYFYDKYEFMPQDGFVEMYRKIIDYPGIEVQLGIEALDHMCVDEISGKVTWDGTDVKIIYTGAIDELFKYKYGVLPYRSLYFKYENINKESFQNVAIVAYPQVEGYTRITEYTKMPFQDTNGWTNAVYEYPVAYNKSSENGNEPYYPVLTKESLTIFEKYKEFASKFSNLILCGRLADFKYYNMDQVILRTLDLYESLEDN
jgi:UDP-galactopyranose mutase